jgi:hypothetical protein
MQGFMNIRLFTVFAAGALVAGACVAGEDKSAIEGLLKADHINFGYLIGQFNKDCSQMDPYSVYKMPGSDLSKLDNCIQLVKDIHINYRKLAPQIKDDELIDVGLPFEHPSFRSLSWNAKKFMEVSYITGQRISLDKDGKVVHNPCQ